MKLPNEATDLIDQLISGIQRELGDNLVAIYPRGSLAYGDFIEGYSDLDLLVVTRQTIEENDFRRLSDFHKRIAKLQNQYARDIEITYVEQEAIHEFQPHQSYPTLERGENETLKWIEHHHNWILERSTMWEYNKVYFGPEPRRLIKQISTEEIIQAVCVRLKDWAEWAENDDEPDWQYPNCYKVYYMETMCRAFYTLQTGKLASKPQSVSWSLENLPSEWRDLVERSTEWRDDKSVDLSINQPIRRFVLWVASSSQCVA